MVQWSVATTAWSNFFNTFERGQLPLHDEQFSRCDSLMLPSSNGFLCAVDFDAPS